MPQGTALQTNSPTPFYAKGEIGCSFNEQNTGNSYVRVQLDSNTTANTANVVYNTGVTTAPPSQPIGTFLSSTITSGTAPVQVNIGFVQ